MCVMLITGKCNRTLDMSYLCTWTVRVMHTPCCCRFCWVICCFFFHKNASSKTSFSQLVTGLCVIQFCLQSYKWQSNQTPSSWSSDFVNLLIWLHTELDSTIINSLFNVLHFVCVNLYLVQNIPEAKWCTAVAIKKCS